MAARLGNVIYWFSLIVAIPLGLFALFGLYGWLVNPGDWVSRKLFIQASVLSGGSWIIGRVARYVLAGR